MIEPYFTNVGKRLTKTPKLYFNDVGLLCFLLGLNQGSVTDSYLIGSIWETLVFAELRKYLSATAPEASIWFYRDQSREVDFVIEKDGRLTLADAKWKELPGPRDFRQLLAVEPVLRTARLPAMVLVPNRRELSGGQGHARGQWVEHACRLVTTGADFCIKCLQTMNCKIICRCCHDHTPDRVQDQGIA